MHLNCNMIGETRQHLLVERKCGQRRCVWKVDAQRRNDGRQRRRLEAKAHRDAEIAAAAAQHRPEERRRRVARRRDERGALLLHDGHVNLDELIDGETERARLKAVAAAQRETGNANRGTSAARARARVCF